MPALPADVAMRTSVTPLVPKKGVLGAVPLCCRSCRLPALIVTGPVRFGWSELIRRAPAPNFVRPWFVLIWPSTELATTVFWNVPMSSVPAL